MEIYTADNVVVHKGDRVYNYYDCEWGTITSEMDQEGWFDFTNERGRVRGLNGERISSVKYM
jgi:hypothetical protein